MSEAWRTLALTSIAVFVVSLDGTVLYVAFPSIRATFSGVSAAQLSWVLNAYTVVFGSLLVPAGRIADRACSSPDSSCGRAGASSPAVDLSLFSDRNYRFANLATFFFAIAFTAMFFNFVFFLTQRWHYTLLQTGLAITPGPLTVIPVAVAAGRIADRRGHRGLLIAGSLIFALGGALLYT